MKLKSLICFSIGLLFAFVAFGHPAKDFVATNKTISYTICFKHRWADEIFVRHYFTDTIARPLDVLIHEMMIDPSPMVGLPNFEWIELKNNASHAINLKGYRLGYGSGQSGPMPNYILLPDSLVILSSSNSAIVLSLLGPSITVTSFPSLGNSAGLLVLKSAKNEIIHSISYLDSWYENPLKKQGGWTLEMIDSHNPCSGGNNWKASIDNSGGTPGKKNSVESLNADQSKPKLLRAFALDSLNLVLIFDEPIDSLRAAKKENYMVDGGIGIPSFALTLGPMFDRVMIKLSSPLARNKIYTLTVASIIDCVGNLIGNSNYTTQVGLSELASMNDMVINEILFNPTPSATDYVEIYNRSNKIFDLKQLYIANRNSLGVISNLVQLSAENNLIFPEEFKVITENTAMVKSNYIVLNKEAVIEVESMPSYNDDRGTVIILNAQGEITDELTYNEKWHFKLIDNFEGVALERVNYNAVTQSAENWHSAATAVGYGTPTYKNSQYQINNGLAGEIRLSPEIFSPDNDGQDDFATINYRFSAPGYVANITIFNAMGRPIRYLQRNALCGTSGTFRWDGLGEKNQPLAVGVYIIFTEIFNLKGNKKQFKNEIVLAKRNSF